MATMVPVGMPTMSDTDFQRTLFNSISLFRGIDPHEISDLLPECGRLDIEKGDTLLSPETGNRCVYVLLSGQLDVHIGSKQNERIATLAPGSCTGEMSIIDDRDPSAFVVAAEDCHLMVISTGLLWEMIERSHTFAKNLLIVLSERVRSDNQFIANSLDVLKRAEQYATTDALTGLGNRHWIDANFTRELARLLRSGEPACLMMIDVDRFKSFNDNFGHIVGDSVIGAVAKVLSSNLRTRDLIGRFGGDEFAVLLPAIDAATGQRTADRLLDSVRKIQTDDLLPLVTISIGVAFLERGDTLKSILDRADRAMYDAKARGRDCVCTR